MPSSGNASKALAGSASVPSQPAIDGNANAPASRGSEETATSVPPVPERSERACACGQTLSEQALFCQKCGKPVSQAKPRCRLTRLGPDRQGESVVMSDDEFTIGKAPECGLAIQDDYVSRRHARLTASDGMLYVEDLGSSNGTFLRVRHPIVLEAGDEILIGSTVLKVQDISI